MTPQSGFFVIAPIVPQREAELRRLLAAMNGAPGRLKQEGCGIPFDQFDELHVARLLIVDDKTVGDNDVYGVPRPVYPLYLAFLGDVDGEGDRFLEKAASRAPAGLRTLFSCCEGFAHDTELVGWMKAHSVAAAANYVNWRGRTVRRIREEALLRDALDERIGAHRAELNGLTASAVHARLRALVGDDIAAGRIRLSPEEPTPFGWRVRNLVHLVAVPAL